MLRPAPVLEPVSIAILPLTIEEGVDPLYAAGMEAEIRSQLARSPNMRVTASESARQMMEQGRGPAEIGITLGTDFVWQGTLGNSADRVFVSGRLIRTVDGSEVWTGELASAPGSGQSLPLRVARQLLGALERPVSPSAAAPNASADDYRIYLTAMGLIRGRGREQRQAARDLLEQVVSRNPDFAEGIGGLAKAYYLYPAENRRAMMAQRGIAKQIAERALAIDPDTIEALKVRGQLGESAQDTLPYLQRAVALDSGDSEAWYWLGIVQRRFQFERANPLESSIRIIEIDPLWPAGWGGSSVAAEYGDLELARKMERDILAAAITPSQKLLAEARLARLDGDLSEFYALTRRAAAIMTPAEHRYGVTQQYRMMDALLALPPAFLEGSYQSRLPAEIMAMLVTRELPDRAALQSEAMLGSDPWADGDFLMMAAPLYLSNGHMTNCWRFTMQALPTTQNGSRLRR